MLNQDLLIAASALLGLVVLAATALKGWQGWLELKDHELQVARPHREIEGGAQAQEGAARIEIADLKERIRKLEAIASGVDL
ncbi:MAG: hypothetical protein ACXWJC_08260 [Croceibacterium sp.]